MNILVISQLYPQPDDKENYKQTKTVEYFAKEWVKNGNNVVVMHCSSKFPVLFYVIPGFIKDKIGGSSSNIIPSIQSRKKIYRENLGIKIYRRPMLKLFPGMGYSEKRIRKEVRSICRLLAEIEFVPELILGHFANPSTAIVANLASHYGAKSSIVFHHDCTDKNKKKYRLEKWVRNIGAVGTRSIVEAKEVQRRLNLSETPFVCYSGVPDDAVILAEKICTKMDISDGIKFIYVGSFIKRKRLDSVIRAFIQSKDQKDSLTIIGGGPEEENLKNLVEQADHDHAVVFGGKLSRMKVMEEMKQAHVFTLISDYETYGMVYMEAMLQGCLVIASKDGGFDGIIVDGKNGFLCNAGDTEMLASIYEKIRKMSTQERNKIGQAAIETAMQYSESEVAKRYLSDVLRNQREI